MKGTNMNKKRNERRTTRVAAVITIAVLMTVSLLGTALAKYITEGGFGDSARVAYWGIGIENTLELFSDKYDETVEARADEEGNVVAPGTNGSTVIAVVEGAGGMPEVAFELSIDALVEFEGWSEETTPINFKVNGTQVEKEEDALRKAIIAVVEGYSEGDELPEITIDWEWPFFESDEADILDTALGNAETVSKVSISATITAEQVD